MSKRITLSARDIEVITAILAYMSLRAEAFGHEARCLLKLQNSELHAIRTRLTGE